MFDKKYDVSDIDAFNKILDFNMSKERKEALLPTFQDWMTRANNVDKKMSKKPYVDIIPSNIFKNE